MRLRTIRRPYVVAHRDEASSIRRGGTRYFASESAISLYMYSLGYIGFKRMAWNIALRFVVQILLPAKIRYRLTAIARKQ